MPMHQGLSLRTSQHLALTPQLQQSIRLLQLSTLELAQEVEQQLADNPFLERDSDPAEDDAPGLPHADTPVSLGDRLSEAAAGIAADLPVPASRQDSDGHSENPGDAALHDGHAEEPHPDSPALDWDGDGSVDIAPHDSEWGNDAPAATVHGSGSHGEPDHSDPADWNSAPLTLQAHLHQQALGLRLPPAQQAALYALIESLDDDGYLSDPLPELAAALVAPPHASQGHPGTPAQRQAQQAELEQLLASALPHLQQMDPTGVGARHLAECLRLQVLELRNSPAARAALALCNQPLDLLARRDTKRLSALCGCDEASVRAGLAVIARLEPKPGRRFAQVERNAIVPDVVVRRSGSGFMVELNPDVVPRLHLHDRYASALRGHKGDSASGLPQRLQEARWFIKNIQQRFDTILRVSRAIVERQRGFFVQGELAMRPLVLREIADELGLHESTISRVTSAKYMATPWGTYELKYFFGSGLGTDSGASTSSTAVRALIRQLIASEPPAKPLSDQQLSDLLKAQGIDCARRTVAKYREALRIAPASLRNNKPLSP